MMSSNHKIIHIVLVLLVLLPAVLQSAVAASVANFYDGYNMTAYTMNDGMPNNQVDDIFRDSRGFLWIAFMGGGLSRFDGYDFINFNDNVNARHHIKSSFVSDIAEDGFGRLWVSGDCGLDVIDLSTMAVAPPPDESGLFKDIADQTASTLTIDSKGALWALGPQNLHRIAFTSDGAIASISSIHIGRFYHRSMAIADVDKNGSVWVGTGPTVSRVRPMADGSLAEQAVSQALTDISGVEYFSDFELHDGQVWISSNIGLFRYDPNSDSAKLYQNEPGNPRSLSQNFITDIAVTDNHRLLAASLKGLNVYNPISDDFERAGSEERNLPNQFINMMLVDGPNIFVATEGGGIIILSPRRLRLTNIGHSEFGHGPGPGNPVNSIIEALDGALWVGTVEGGLNVRLPGQSRFIHISAEDGRLSHNSVSSMAIDSNGRMWVGTWGGGIDVLSMTPPFQRLFSLNSSTVGQPLAFIGTLVSDSTNGGMFIGSNAGLLYYDLDSGALSPAIAPDGDVDAFGFVGSLVDKDSRLWIGSARGLLTLDLKKRFADGTFSYEFTRNRLDDPVSTAIENPTSFFQSPDGSIWIGTNGHGIYHGKRENTHYKYSNLTTDHGLANNQVRGIIGDANGNLWISTINGLSSYNPSQHNFTNYTKADGLPDNQFYWNSAFAAKDGSLLFGNVGGLVVLEPDTETSRQMLHNVVFTRLHINNKPIFGATGFTDGLNISSAKNITLHESDKSFQVEFSALDFERRDNSFYKYRLKGFDKDWISVASDRRWASYTNLAPGKYTLEVKYMPNGDDPDAPVASIPVVIKPYFYKTWWFNLLLFCIVAFGILAVYKFRINSLKRQRKLLQTEVERSTAKMAEQKLIAEERADQLAQRNEQLMAQNEEINRQKAQLTEMNNRVSQLTFDRIQFFTNLTHELRTPITLILGPIERVMKMSTDRKVLEQLSFVDRNSRYLLTLVNQLMDFRKIESGKMGVSYTRNDIRQSLEDMVAPFVPMAAERHISIDCLFHLNGHPQLVYDEDSLRKVVINLLSNAIKFTPDHGIVRIYFAFFPEITDSHGQRHLNTTYLAVSDTGNGIAEKDIDHVFDRFYQGESSLKYPVPGAGDSGIGLYICRQIVELHGGHIWVRNNRGPGCTFRAIVDIPPEVNIQEDDAIVGGGHAPVETTPTAEEGKPTVMVVEDNDDMRAYICSILRDHYNIIDSPSGEEALAMLADNLVDFIISDLMMPGMSGIDLSRRVKENLATSHIPFLMLTAKTATQSRIDSYRIGVDDYLLKPFQEEVLLARIEGILANRRRQQHNFSMSMDSSSLNVETESRDKKFIDSVMSTIRDNYKNSFFEVGDFAEALGISRSLLNKKLQSLVGQSASQLVRNYRLNMARELILKNRHTHAMNISEIAYAVGFNDSKYFTRCFTKQFNVTPSSLMQKDNEVEN